MQTITRAHLVDAFEHTFERIETLVAELSEQQRQVLYHPGINPPVWEFGHSTFFYEHFLLKALDGTESVDPSMDDIWDSFQLDHLDRWSQAVFPGFNETREYAAIVRQRVLERLQNKPLLAHDQYLYRYAIYHQNMHIESMIWARQTLALPPPPDAHVGPDPDDADTAKASATIRGDAGINSGRFVIGLPSKSDDLAGADFGFDAEKPRFEVELDAFAIGRTLVSNGQFLEFVEAGGYAEQAYWSQGGKSWLHNPHKRPLAAGEAPLCPGHPQYWRHQNSDWEQRVFDRWLPLDPDLPVLHVSYWEAEAWCNWAGRRLPTEFEWEAAALNNRPGKLFQTLPWEQTGTFDSVIDPALANMDGRSFAATQVTALADGSGEHGCLQMIGTCWEWTSSQFLPYDGFTMDMYPYMSTLQFGNHQTARGGSCATSSSLIRGTYRQAYQPDRFDTFTGFRSCAV